VSDHTKAIMSTIVIVACLALIGVMVYLKVPEAGLAGVAVVTTIVAWLSRTPDRKDPPPGSTLVPLIAAGILLASILACGCSDPPPKLPEPTVQQKETVAGAKYTEELLACETGTHPDACEAAVRAKWGRLPDGGKQ